MSQFNSKKLREFSVKRWQEWMGMTHGVEHWDRVANFGRMLYKDGNTHRVSEIVSTRSKYV